MKDVAKIKASMVDTIKAAKKYVRLITEGEDFATKTPDEAVGLFCALEILLDELKEGQDDKDLLKRLMLISQTIELIIKSGMDDAKINAVLDQAIARTIGPGITGNEIEGDAGRFFSNLASIFPGPKGGRRE